ncbi:MAG TPA: crossover junction endodeoxyribonuclease RuvC [Bacteroidota bacterium]|jgi:crossover junction endodeoxyribonuclease RuvC
MIVLGVDPGTLATGYGLIEDRNGSMNVLASGCIKNDGRASMPLRLKRIFDILSEVIETHHPDEFAIETAFYGKNAQSALKLGHARGVAMLAAVSREIPTQEYSPREVKRAIVGNGTASKEQVQYMVTVLLNLKKSPLQHDITDALAVAMCHLHRRHAAPRTTSGSWKSYLAAHPDKVLPAPRSQAR